MPDLPDPETLAREGGATAADAVSEEQLWSWVDRDAPELEAHLAAWPEDRARVDELRRAIRAVASSGPERVPSRIGPYPIVRRLGSGDMGVVFASKPLTESLQHCGILGRGQCRGHVQPNPAIRIVQQHREPRT